MARSPVGRWVLGGGSVALAAAVAAWLALRVQPEPPAPVATSLVPPQAAVPTAAPTPPPVAAPEPPSFDVVRVEAAGGALVAGRAAPGAEVVLSLDEVPVARTLADAAGQFVAMFELGASAVPQVLTLAAVQADGTLLAAPDVVVLAPRGGAEADAPVAPVADPAPADPAPAEPAPAEIAVAGSAPADPVAAENPAAPLAAAEPAGPVPGAASLVPEPVASGTEAAPAPPETVAGAAPEPDPVDPARSIPVPVATAAAPETVPEPAPETGPQTGGVSPDAPAAPVELAAVTEPAAPEPAPPAAFVVEAGGGVRLLDRAPQVLDNVVIDAIGYGPEGDVQISGRTRQVEGGTPLRVYLNNQPVALARSEGADWRLDLPRVDPGVYTLRVDELSPDGRVVSRFETPFLREDPAAVARMFGTAPPAPEAAAPPESAAAAAPGPMAALRPETEPPAPAAQGAAATPAPETVPEPVPGLAPVSARPAVSAAAPPEAPPAPRVMLVTVQPGHTLWRLSREHYGEGTRYLQIYRANRAQIRDPDLIYPGQIFAIPD